MAADRLPQLNATELAVMKLLWREGRLSAREVHERLGGEQGWAYSTTRTVVERMVGKGLVGKQEFHGLRLYAAAISRPVGLAGLIRDFARDVLESGPEPVVALFTAGETLTDAEVAELEALLQAEDDRG